MEIMPNLLIKKGEIVFHEGDEADGVYYVCSGRMKVTRKMGEASQLLAELEEGDIFGELAMVDNRLRAATLTALEDSWVYKFSADVFRRKMEECDPLMRSIITTLVLTVRNMQIKHERLAAHLGYPKDDVAS